jgi:hypothetical protein
MVPQKAGKPLRDVTPKLQHHLVAQWLHGMDFDIGESFCGSTIKAVRAHI